MHIHLDFTVPFWLVVAGGVVGVIAGVVGAGLWLLKKVAEAS